MVAKPDFDDVKLSELTTFVSAARARSLSAAARELGVTPSQVSKALARLETRLHTKLLRRTAKGVQLTDQGNLLLPKILELSTLVRSMGSEISSARSVVTVGAPSYLASTIAAAAAAATRGSLRMRIIEQGPTLLRAALPERIFEFALFVGDEKTPAGWDSTLLGHVQNGLIARPSFLAKLGKAPLDESRLLPHPFVLPLNVSGVAISPNDDGCPIPIGSRIVGAETQTLAAGLEVAMHADMFVYGPLIVARRYISAGLLSHVPVRGWKSELPVTILSSDLVLARIKREVVGALRAAFG